MGQYRRILDEAAGGPQRDWQNTITNSGLIRYTTFFNIERVLVTSPRGLAEVLVHKNYDFIKPKVFSESLARLLGVGILLAEGDEHKVAQRKHLMPAFAYRHIRDLYPLFWKKSRELAGALTFHIESLSSFSSDTENTKCPSEVIEVSEWASRATLDIIGIAGMGHDFGAIRNADTEMNLTYRKVFHPSKAAQLLGILNIFLPFWFVKRIPIKRNGEVEAAAETVKRVCMSLIQEKKLKLESKASADVDILSVALESGRFSDDDLVNQSMTFLAAGHETTASALVWAIFLMCKHPDIQQRLRRIIHKQLPSVNDTSSTVTASNVDSIPYLYAVCNEVLRLFAPVPITLREACVNTTILGQNIPKGTTLLMAPWATNLEKEQWGADAAEFVPDRWMGHGKANNGGAESNYSFMTFLHGPRSCIGQSFARAEFACLLAAMVGRFEMELADKDYKLVIKGGITSKPYKGLLVRMKVIDGW
ncbi:MAG: hypothetical protein M1829_000386 [Trizodia sp. TS-e1964]|nr:MAG: hypothetical protein M1829_000386 [Trizodia sp. TS-e1964]